MTLILKKSFNPSLKNSFFRVGVLEKPIHRGDCLKRGAWIVCTFKGVVWQERGGGIFEGG